MTVPVSLADLPAPFHSPRCNQTSISGSVKPSAAQPSVWILRTAPQLNLRADFFLFAFEPEMVQLRKHRQAVTRNYQICLRRSGGPRSGPAHFNNRYYNLTERGGGRDEMHQRGPAMEGGCAGYEGMEPNPGVSQNE